jgi:fluoride exporter
MPVAVAVAMGGAFGALARYALVTLLERKVVSVFPWDVFAVNISGCLLVGLIVSALVDRHHTPEWLRVGLVLAFVGAYTTFSTFVPDLYDFGQARQASRRSTSSRASAEVCSQLPSEPG